MAVKEAVLPFNKFPEESIFLSPEMKSTGEVMGISNTLGDAFKRASISAGNVIPSFGTVFLSVNDADKLDVIPIARDLKELVLISWRLPGRQKSSAETVFMQLQFLKWEKAGPMWWTASRMGTSIW